MLCGPKPLLLVLQGYKWCKHSEVWTAGVTGKQRLIDWGPEQISGKHTWDEFPRWPETTQYHKLKAANVPLPPPIFTFWEMNRSFILNVIKPLGKFPLKTYSEKVPHSHLLTHNHPLKWL